MHFWGLLSTGPFSVAALALLLDSQASLYLIPAPFLGPSGVTAPTPSPELHVSGTATPALSPGPLGITAPTLFLDPKASLHLITHSPETQASLHLALLLNLHAQLHLPLLLDLQASLHLPLLYPQMSPHLSLLLDPRRHCTCPIWTLRCHHIYPFSWTSRRHCTYPFS
ncbi:hypothetical protein PoB_001419500 [Plakobranchus ocellatus]|uniref:Uncharacterized protein n=1 Tax=Plakobranchus ocellatus TaxID=259542 RepID=A0AAV3YXS7_9GAST|nr:hypothetical protein PoB_001419500 [Plakobranchus ocellatus]